MKYRWEIIALAVLVALAILMFSPHMQFPAGEQREGTDEIAADAIRSSGYTPWMDPLWQPPNKEAELLLFGVQAAIGIAVIGYVVRHYRTRRE